MTTPAASDEYNRAYDDAWEQMGPAIRAKLGPADSLPFWCCCVSGVVAWNHMRYRRDPSSRRVALVIGRCSHWLRPHQARYTGGGGFAAPYGYGPCRRPEFDWSLTWIQDRATGEWRPVGTRIPRGALTLRVALPGRTRRHRQAAVHAEWIPGSPRSPRERRLQFFFLRKGDSGWKFARKWVQPEKRRAIATTAAP